VLSSTDVMTPEISDPDDAPPLPPDLSCGCEPTEQAKEADMSTTSDTAAPSLQADPGLDPWARWLPLAGLGYGILTLAGDLVIGDFPDEKTSTNALVRYYGAHHAQVARGGQLMILGAVFLGLFVAGLAARARRKPSAAAVIAVGGAAMMAAEIASGSIYLLLGNTSTDPHLSPEALQAWHIAGAAFGSSAATAVFLAGVALCGFAARAVPRWLAVTALVIALGLLAPGFGFLFSMLSLPWAAMAAIVIATHRATD
jgi:hypothetical protein